MKDARWALSRERREGWTFDLARGARAGGNSREGAGTIASHSNSAAFKKLLDDLIYRVRMGDWTNAAQTPELHELDSLQGPRQQACHPVGRRSRALARHVENRDIE